MDCFQTISRLKGSLGHQFLLFIVWLSSFQVAVALQTLLEPQHVSSTSELATPPISGIFGPIEISPAVFPRNPYPGESLAPMYPTFPTMYKPNLTGKCPVNFTALSNVIDKTASDCSQPLAALVGNVICCPQLGSLLHIFQGYYSVNSDKLVLQNAVADDCFSDIISILASRGANKTIPTLCSVKSLNLTGGLCPVKDVVNFEKIINTSKLLDACSTVDPLKECCRPICQSAITEAALEMSRTQLTINDNKELVTEHNGNGPLSDCKGVVHSYLSRKLSVDAANAAFRTVSACKVNKVCPLNFTQPLEVIKACRNVAAPSPSCCSSLNTYIAGIQNQMLITNKQAIICATVLGSKLRQGCLLRSLPPDVILDNSTGFSFTCDLNDNIAAPWPSSSSMSTLSLCAPEMSLPALPTSQIKNPGNRGGGELELLSCGSTWFIDNGHGKPLSSLSYRQVGLRPTQIRVSFGRLVHLGKASTADKQRLDVARCFRRRRASFSYTKYQS
ncbi:GPI-ANCHORED PROTEIN [Salix koriyanagi]|uniref:GPI-ANCHORED PROTEIN n=1 Tax=Salix koriyanagi TaxID=2511006 RepID=A0A9Q0ZGQ7_9ROSI|nr:GPI-ANCHORED PROTEIN [Salix koriyanagi]